MSLVAFARANARWLGAGLALTFCSSAGQTFFIASFAADIRGAHGLGHGGFGLVYMIATLASAASLVALGRVVDTMSPARVASFTIAALAGACLLMAASHHVATLGLALWALRLFGQGMLSHLAMTVSGRWFVAARGRAVSIVTLGHQLGEAALPLVAVLLLAHVGWRGAWLATAAVLVLVALPSLRALLAVPREPSGAERATVRDARQWTRAEVLTDPLFYLVLPGVLSPAFIGTSVFFHQVHLSELKGWPPEAMASAFAAYAAATVACTLLTGRGVDRYSAARLLPVFLAPLAAACWLLSGATEAVAIYGFMLLLGLSTGASSALFGALWPELYGTLHLGAVRSVVFAAMVFGTALGPGLTGALIDAGVGFEDQLVVMALWCVAATAVLWAASARLVARADAALQISPSPTR